MDVPDSVATSDTFCNNSRDLGQCVDVPDPDLHNGDTPHVVSNFLLYEFLLLNASNTLPTRDGKVEHFIASADASTLPVHSLHTDINSDASFEPFLTPISPGNRSVYVFRECILGTCTCSHMLDGMCYQLKPCRFAALMCDSRGFRKPGYANLFYGIIDGFPVVNEDVDVPSYECKNYLSILSPEAKVKMDKIIRDELSEGMIAIVEEKPKCVHALGAVIKPDGGIRPITDCSRPPDIAVNNFSESLIENFHYKSVNDVVKDLRTSDYMSVIDIKSAYRAVAIQPSHRDFLGFSWELDGKEHYFHDRRLCFGLRTGPYQFNLISSFIAEVLFHIHGIKVVQYLDDFLCTGPTFTACQLAQNHIIRILRFLGFYVSWKKVSAPSQVCVYLGIEIDSIKMELRLPEGKLTKIRDLLSQVANCTVIDKKTLERLTGYLAHCATIVRGGRLFCRNLYNLYKVMHSKNLQRIRMPKSAIDDIQWWSTFASTFNGKSAIANPICEFVMYSDSSFAGYGAHMAGDWVVGQWTTSPTPAQDDICQHTGPTPDLSEPERLNINVLEMWPVLVGLRRWAHYFAGKSVILYVDNTQVMYMLSNTSSTNSKCLTWLKEIFWLCIDNDIQLLPRYISSGDNFIADALSRLHGDKHVDVARLALEVKDWCCSKLLLSFFDRCTGDIQETTATTLDVSFASNKDM